MIWSFELRPGQFSHPESILGFDDGAVEDGGLGIVRNVDDPGDVLTRGRRNGVAHFLYEVLGADIASTISEEAVLPVHGVLGLDLTR